MASSAEERRVLRSAGWSKLDRSQEKTGPLTLLESCQPVVGGRSKTGASGGSSGSCSSKDASFRATTETVGGLSGQGNEPV